MCFTTGLAVCLSRVWLKNKQERKTVIKISIVVLLIHFIQLFSVFSQAHSQSSVVKFQKETDRIINQKFLENAIWGIHIQSVKNGEVIYSHQSKKNMIPASNMKIFTSVFALDKLGPDFQYTTAVYLHGTFDSDTSFTGNVILKGMGDPTISGRYFDNKVTRIPEDWADSLAARKIRVIHGKIIGDDNFFGDDALGKHWEWDEESYWYSAQVSGLSFNDNCVNWYVTPTRVGDRAKIQLVPGTNYVTIENHITTVATASESEEIEFIRGRRSNLIKATGKIAVNADTHVGYVTVENPTLYTATVMTEILNKKGIHVDNEAVDIDSLPFYTYHDSDSTVIRVASYESPKLEEILKVVNKRSQNLFAEQLLRTVAAVVDSNGTGQHALKLEKEFLKQIGINPVTMCVMDGSGYSRTNLVTPESIVAMLKYIRQHRYWKIFYESLPKAGIERTLNHRMKNTPAEGNVRAKTGTMDNVSTISGFVKTADNEEMVFSILCNNFSVDHLEVQKVQDSILVKLASFTRN